MLKNLIEDPVQCIAGIGVYSKRTISLNVYTYSLCLYKKIIMLSIKTTKFNVTDSWNILLQG